MSTHSNAPVKIDRSKIAALDLVGTSSGDPCGKYNPTLDVYVVVALINSGITDAEAAYAFRMWALSLEVINHIMSSESDFPPEHIMTVWDYINKVHATKSNSLRNHIFTHTLWYLRCSCSYRIQTGVLSWIQNYSNNSATPATSFPKE